MGCCSSRDADSAPNPRFAADTSQRTTGGPVIYHPASETPSGIPAISRPTRPELRQSTLPLGEHFNQPVRPHVWESEDRIWTRATIDDERRLFFPRYHPRPEVWNALETVITLLRAGDVPTAQGIIDAAGITIPTGDLCEGCYDERGGLYTIPDEIASDPINLAEDKPAEESHGHNAAIALEEHQRDMSTNRVGVDSSGELLSKENGDRNATDQDHINVTARLNGNGPQDVVVRIGRGETVDCLIQKLKTEVEIPDNNRVSLLYSGKILEGGQTILDQGWKEGHVVNVHVLDPM